MGSTKTFSTITTDFDSAGPMYGGHQQFEVQIQRPVPFYLSHAEIVTATAKLAEIGGLRENWDGQGSVAIDKDAGGHALRHLSRILGLAPTPDLVPNQNGTISFVWESELGHAQLEIGRTRTSFFMSSSDGMEKFGDGMSAEIQIHIAELVAGMLYPQEKPVEASSEISIE